MKIPALAAAACLALTACISAGPPGPGAPAPAKSVDAARFYTGTWREIGRRPLKLTDGCVAGTTTYSPGPASAYRVIDGCNVGTPAGKLKTIGGPGTIQDPGFNAKLRVRYSVFGLPVTREYWVLDHAADYSWFISADPTFRDLWIYTRNPVVTAPELNRLVQRARELGYDVGKLEFPAQPAG